MCIETTFHLINKWSNNFDCHNCQKIDLRKPELIHLVLSNVIKIFISSQDQEEIVNLIGNGKSTETFP